MSSLDERLLNEQNVNYFNNDLKEFLLNKGKNLQYNTGLKIIKRFLYKEAIST